MKKEKFDEVWENIFLKIYDDINLPEEVYIKQGAKQRVYAKYQEEKNYLKNHYMENHKTHLDRHKIAACMMYAIVMVSPIAYKNSIVLKKYVNKETYVKPYNMLNEFVALYTALSIVESFREYDELVHRAENRFKRPGGCQPMTTNGESYIYNTCLDLYLSKKKNKINVLTFANVFFLLETGVFMEARDKQEEK